MSDSILVNIEDKLKHLRTLLDDIKDKDEPNFRIIHFKKNPFDCEINREEEEYEALKSENERLRARLSLVETGVNLDVTMRIDEAVNNAHHIAMLKQSILDYKEREKKLLPPLKKATNDFRKACFDLVGFRVDNSLNDNIYRLTSKYAVRREDKLLFEVNRDGTIKLKEDDYSRYFTDHISTYIQHGDSFPAFLAAITLDLFKEQAKASAVDMSLTMIPK